MSWLAGDCGAPVVEARGLDVVSSEKTRGAPPAVRSCVSVSGMEAAGLVSTPCPASAIRPPPEAGGAFFLACGETWPQCGRQSSVQAVVAGDQPDLGGRDQLLMRDRHAVEPALEVAGPEVEEAAQAGKARVHVVLLPDVALQQRGMVGQAIEDFGRRQTVAGELGEQAPVGESRHGSLPLAASA